MAVQYQPETENKTFYSLCVGNAQVSNIMPESNVNANIFIITVVCYILEWFQLFWALSATIVDIYFQGVKDWTVYRYFPPQWKMGCFHFEEHSYLIIINIIL